MRFLLHLVAIFAAAIVIGLGSAWYMIDTGSALTTNRIGPWTVWHAAGAPQADPYTKAHLARTGSLPITSTSALYYIARLDGEGSALVSACEYVVEGGPMSAAWWSIAAYEASGGLIANKAKRHSFNSRDIVQRVDGSYRIVLARTARPGNWLPTGDDMELQLILRVFAPRGTAGVINAAAIEQQLPSITKVGCES